MKKAKASEKMGWEKILELSAPGDTGFPLSMAPPKTGPFTCFSGPFGAALFYGFIGPLYGPPIYGRIGRTMRTRCNLHLQPYLRTCNTRCVRPPTRQELRGLSHQSNIPIFSHNHRNKWCLGRTHPQQPTQIYGCYGGQAPAQLSYQSSASPFARAL